ncbi:MAG: hypothetical protein SPD54_13135 [Parabacteroides sp.]|nr:hypothetical protein [Parabacteroides sp.]
MIHKFFTTLGLAFLGIALAQAASYRWQQQGEQLALVDGTTLIGTIQTEIPASLQSQFESEQLDTKTFRLTCRLTATETGPAQRISIAFSHQEQADWWMIPAISYQGNPWGRGQEPKGAYEDGTVRTYSYRRTPIPGAVYSEGTRYAVATWSNVPSSEKEAFSCGIAPTDQESRHLLIWPEEEQPRSYIAKDTYGNGFTQSVQLQQGETLHLTLYVHVTTTEPDHRAQASFLQKAWQMSDKPSVAIFEPEKIWQVGIDYAKQSLWAEEGTYRGFSIGLVWDQNQWIQRPGWKYEIGWCGQNASFANSLLYDYLLNGNEESKEKALLTLDTWSRDCLLPNGLFVTNYDYLLDGNTNGVVDGCNLGTAAVNFLEADSLVRRCGETRPYYREVALRILNFLVKDQRADGCYGKGWKMDGTCLYREGTIGAFILPAMIDAFRLTGDRRYYDSACRAYHYYMGGLLRDGYTTAGALDTWCIDKESAISLLRASMRFYKLTQDSRYLSDAVTVSYYLSTWLWHYDGVYAADDMMTKFGYHTFGATSVSVQHHHLDPYALFWIPEWLELAQQTGDAQWREKALAIWRNGCQLISDGSLVIEGHLRPVGSQNEAYFESNWNFSHGERINSWLVAWPGAFRLETLRRLHGDWSLLK